MSAPKFLYTQKAFIVRDRCLLAAKKSDAALACAGLWEFPGGRLEFGEELDLSFMREVKEETGLTITPGRTFHNYSYQTEPTVQIIAAARHATCDDFSSLSMLNHMVDENIERLDWIPFEALDTTNWIPNLRPVVEVYKGELRAMGLLPSMPQVVDSALPQRIPA